MNIAVVSIGSFDAQYSDYHIMKDILCGILERNNNVVLYQKQYRDIPEYPSEFKEYMRRGQLNVKNFPFVKAEKNNLKGRYIADIKYYISVCKQMKKNEFDAVFLQSNNTAFVMVWYAKNILKTPLVYNEQDIFPENARFAGILKPSSVVYRIAKVLQKYAYKNSTALCTISPDMKKTICENFNVKDNKVHVIYNWGHEELFVKDRENNIYLKCYPKKENEFRVMYAGNLGKMQNVEFVLQAAARMKQDNDIKFYIVGNGANENELKKFATDNELTNTIFLDMQPSENVADLYDSADVNLVPLKEKLIYAALPSKTADCLLANKPIIACIDSESKFSRLLKEYGITNAGVTDPNMLCEAIHIMKQRKRTDRNEELKMACFDKVKNVEKYCSLIENASFQR